MRTFLRGLAVATTLSLAPLAAAVVTAAPAQAAATVSTAVSYNPGIKTRGFAGSYLSISGTVTAADGSYPAGSAYLQRRAPGSTTWRNVDVDNSASSAYFFEHDKFVGNALYRIYYAGGVSGETTYTASVSPVLSIWTARNIVGRDVSDRRAVRVRTTVKPAFGGKKIVVQQRKNGAFRTIRKVRTNRQGVAVVSVAGSRRGIRYRLVAPADRNYISSHLTFTARIY